MRSTQITSTPPVGLILAGGAGARIGGGKASVAVRGQPLLHYALAAMREVVRDVAVITKPDTVLPRLDGAMVWVEPERPVHPLFGVSEALALAGGRSVLVCPVDMPFITAHTLGALAGAKTGGHDAVVASSGGTARPLVGLFMPSAAVPLAQAVQGQRSLEAAIGELDVTFVEVEEEVELFDVNSPDDLLQAAGMLDGLRRPVRA